LISRTAMMSTPYWSSPMAKLTNWIDAAAFPTASAVTLLFGLGCLDEAIDEAIF
jgi:hypothetical protein